MTVEIRRTPRYYEAYLDGERVGQLGYGRRGGVVTAIHTEVEPAAEGKGVGGRLARALLDDARAAGERVVPLCPFVKGWIERHPDYADLVTG
jgi:predicted GNAT family acetyltransferase